VLRKNPILQQSETGWTLKDGTSGFLLAPSARGHTTLVDERAVRLARAAGVTIDSIESNKQPTALVFRPVGSIQWPKRCIGCFSENPSGSLSLGVYYGTEHTTEGVFKRAVFLGWWTPAVILIEGVAKAAAMSKAGEVQAYTLPICRWCKSQLSRREESELGSSERKVGKAILRREILKRSVVLTFQNSAYDAAFRIANAGLVYDSVDDCLAAEKSLKEGVAATAPPTAQAKEAKKVPCKGCARMISNGELVCQHCGHTRWGSIVSYFFIGLALLGVGYEFCGPGAWRWIWWILGALLTLPIAHGLQMTPAMTAGRIW
jgi:hypothetical protein